MSNCFVFVFIQPLVRGLGETPVLVFAVELHPFTTLKHKRIGRYKNNYINNVSCIRGLAVSVLFLFFNLGAGVQVCLLKSIVTPLPSLNYGMDQPMSCQD